MIERKIYTENEGYREKREDMEIEHDRNETMFTVRDSLNGNKLYEIIRLYGEAEVLDYVMGLRRKIKTSELYEWLTGLSL